MAKLSGLIIVSAALVAGSIVGLVFIRRITRGMIGRVVGALAALAVVYVAFLEGAAALHLLFVVPWVAGMSWTDLMTTIFLPARSLCSNS